MWPDQKHTRNAYSRFIVTEIALYWFRTDLVHCGHIDHWSISWNSLRQFRHSWLFCWASAKTSPFFCGGGDKNWWSSQCDYWQYRKAEGLTRYQKSIVFSYQVNRYRLRSQVQRISVALLTCCSQTSVLKYQCLAIYNMTNGYCIVTTDFMVFDSFVHWNMHLRANDWWYCVGC